MNFRVFLKELRTKQFKLSDKLGKILAVVVAFIIAGAFLAEDKGIKESIFSHFGISQYIACITVVLIILGLVAARGLRLKKSWAIRMAQFCNLLGLLAVSLFFYQYFMSMYLKPVKTSITYFIFAGGALIFGTCVVYTIKAIIKLNRISKIGDAKLTPNNNSDKGNGL